MTRTCKRGSMSMIDLAIEEEVSEVEAWEDWRIKGCTIRFGE
jgi:hypothetical protein